MENKTANVLPKTVRINRFIAMSGAASRRKAEELILSGEVTVNGILVTDLATKIDPAKDTVTINGKKIHREEQLVYLVLNKPNDYITTRSDERRRRTVFDLINPRERVFSVGRLDRKTTGVLLFTNDGELANRLMHPSHEVEKTYHVMLTEGLGREDVERVKKGVYIEGGRTAPAKVESIPGTKNKDILITIHEGKNRQVRRVFETLGYEIQKLDRIVYAGITAAGLKRGAWRYLSIDEVKKMKRLAGLSREAEQKDSSAARTPRKKIRTRRSGV
ncbi:MAG: pseudouridine synthase [Ignavibacteriales bacterium]|nr:pseudouridine synthase [Ignavibacteriales bacterium]